MNPVQFPALANNTISVNWVYLVSHPSVAGVLNLRVNQRQTDTQAETG